MNLIEDKSEGLHTFGTLASNNCLRTLTALRFFASFSILLDHFQYIFLTHNELGKLPNFTPSVSFFFMLSGFMLAHTYLPRPPASTWQFVAKRLARIWPLHAVMLIATMVLLPKVVEPTWHLSEAPWILLSNFFLLQAWIPMEPWYFSFNIGTWSLSVLLFCYCLFPTLLKGLRQYWGRYLAMAVLVCVGMVFSGSHFPLFLKSGVDGQGFDYISPLTRFLEFYMGMCGALWLDRFQDRFPRNSGLFTLLELAALGLLMAILGPVRTWIGQPALIPVLGPEFQHYLDTIGLTLIPIFLVINIFAIARGKISSLLYSRLPVFLGEQSFGIYMFHVTLIHLYLYPVALKPYAPQPTAEKYLIYFIGLILLSYLSARFFEKPVAGWIKRQLI